MSFSFSLSITLSPSLSLSLSFPLSLSFSLVHLKEIYPPKVIPQHLSVILKNVFLSPPSPLSVQQTRIAFLVGTLQPLGMVLRTTSAAIAHLLQRATGCHRTAVATVQAATVQADMARPHDTVSSPLQACSACILNARICVSNHVCAQLLHQEKSQQSNGFTCPNNRRIDERVNLPCRFLATRAVVALHMKALHELAVHRCDLKHIVLKSVHSQ